MKKALIIDDLEPNLYLLRTMLEGHGYEVICAANGAEALDLARSTPPDIAISDILMPTMDGFALLREWKKDGELCNIPLIIYTATYTDPRDEQLALSLGAARFIVKPVEPEVLIDAVRQVMQEGATAKAVLQENPDDETVYYRMYSETLIKKLEHKMLELEKANKALKQETIEHRRSKEALRESEKKYRELVESANSIILRWTPVGTITFFNEFAEKFFGFSKDEILGKAAVGTILSEYDSANRDLSKMVLDIAENPEKYSNHENENIRKDGSRVWISWTNKAIYDPDGSIIEILSVGQDITARKKAEDELLEWCNRYELVVAASGQVAYEYDVPTGSIIWGATIETILGYTKKEMSGGFTQWEKLLHPEDRPGTLEQRNDALTSCSYWDAQYRMRHKNGDYVWLRDRGFFLPDAAGKAARQLGMLEDITQRKKMEDTLQETSRHLATAQRIAHVGSWQRNLQTGELYWSEETRRIFGWPLDKPVTLDDFMQCIHPDDKASLEQQQLQACANAAPIDIDYRIIRSDGTIRFVHENCELVHDDQGRLIMLNGYVQDITGRKQAENLLHESEDSYRRQFSHNFAVMLLIDPADGRILEANSAASRFYGYSRERLKDMHVCDLNTLPSDQVRAKMSSVTNAEGALFEFQHRMADGSVHDVEVFSSLIILNQRQVLHSIIIDISDRKKSELALQLKNEELIRFNYTVSHDLRSPLVTIKTFLGYLEHNLANGDTENAEKDMGYIHSAADKMDALLQDLLDLSRIGRVANIPVESPLQDLVQDALAMVAGGISERNVQVQVTDQPVVLYGDRSRLLEVFQNIIDNAVKFMGSQAAPMIEIGAEEKKGETVLFVRDNGMGIDLRHKDRLFGLFEKLNPAMGGTGLGLALAKRIVEVHGGRIWVESEGPGKGACFWFTLPRKEVQG